MRVITSPGAPHFPLLEASLKLSLNNFLNQNVFDLPQFLELQVPFDYPDVVIAPPAIRNNQRNQGTFPPVDNFSMCHQVGGNGVIFEVLPDSLSECLQHYQVGGMTEDEVGFYVYLVALHRICSWMLRTENAVGQAVMDPVLVSELDDVMTSLLCLSIVAENSENLNCIYRNNNGSSFDVASNFYSRMPYWHAMAVRMLENLLSPSEYNTGPMPLFAMLDVWRRRKQTNLPFVGLTENRLTSEEREHLTLGRLYLLYSDWRKFFDL